MTVDEHIDTGDLLQQVDGAVGGGGSLLVDAQVAQADDVVALSGGQGIHLLLGDLIHLLAAGKGHALDLGGIGLGSGLRGIQTEHADLGAVGGLEGDVVTKSQLPVVLDVGGQNGELGGLGVGLKDLVAIVELVVARSSHIVTHQVHQLNGSSALGDADGGIALAEVARVHQQDVGALGLIFGLQGGDLGVLRNSAMDVVGVQDDDAAVKFRRIGRFFICEGGDRHAKGHDHRQQQSKKLVPLFHIGSS